MNQLNIFNVIGLSNDPLYKRLGSLDSGHIVAINLTNDCEIVIRKNIFGLYELSNTEIEQSFTNLSDVYEFVNNLEVEN